MSFAVAAQSYDRFMGRYAEPLAPVFAEFAEVRPGLRALDVGCGTGALTSALVERLGADSVAAVDPSTSFIEAIAERHPGVSVHLASAERLPFDTGGFDLAMAQLVVHFMDDPVIGIREMGRVSAPGGTVAACVWDFEQGGGPLDTFWRAVRDIDPASPGESDLPGTRRGQLGEIFRTAGLHEVEETTLTITVVHATFDDWWEPYTLGVGPAGAYVAALGSAERLHLRDHCRGLFPSQPFDVSASAWAARGRVRSAA